MEFRFLLAANFNVFRDETKNKIFEHVKVRENIPYNQYQHLKLFTTL